MRPSSWSLRLEQRAGWRSCVDGLRPAHQHIRFFVLFRYGDICRVGFSGGVLCGLVRGAGCLHHRFLILHVLNLVRCMPPVGANGCVYSLLFFFCLGIAVTCGLQCVRFLSSQFENSYICNGSSFCWSIDPGNHHVSI